MEADRVIGHRVVAVTAVVDDKRTRFTDFTDLTEIEFRTTTREVTLIFSDGRQKWVRSAAIEYDNGETVAIGLDD